MKIRSFNHGGALPIDALVRRGVFVLRNPVEVVFDDGMSLTIPAGFPFDGASIPPLARSVIQSLTIAGYLAFVLHDYAYAEGARWRNAAGLEFTIERIDADKMALALCEWLDLHADDRIEIYQALRIAGAASFRRLPVDRTVDQVAATVRR